MSLGQDVRYAVRAAIRSPVGGDPGDAGVRAGHRRDDRRVQHLQQRAAGAAAVPGPGATGRRLRHAAGLRHLPGVLSEVLRLEDAEPGVLGDGRVHAGVVRADRARRRRAGQRALRRRRRSTTSSACQPQLGRWYTEEEDQPGGPKVVVLAYKFWQRRFSGDPSVIGRKLIFDGEPYEVIGVMPRDLHPPQRRFLRAAAAQARSRARAAIISSPTYARLKPGVPLDRAIREMRALGAVLAKEFGYNHGIDVRSYREVVVGAIRGPLQVLMGAVFCVLLIACANVANLLLAVGPGAAARDRRPAGARRRPEGRRAAADLRSAGAVARRRRPRPAARDLDRARVRRPRREQPAAGRDDSHRRPRAGVHGRHLDRRRPRLRPVAAAPAAAEDADDGAARRGHADGERRRDVRQRPRHRRDRASPSRCSSAPA